MRLENIILTVIAGGLLGVLGQGIRVIAGLKKANDIASASQMSFTAVFETKKLLLSLFIGFVAGAIAQLAAPTETVPTDFFKQIAPILAAGYAGTDFIEAFMKKHIPTK